MIEYPEQAAITILTLISAGLTFLSLCLVAAYLPAIVISTGIISVRAFYGILFNVPRNFPVISGITEGAVFVVFFYFSIIGTRIFFS